MFEVPARAWGAASLAALAVPLVACGEFAQDGPPACEILAPTTGHTALKGEPVSFTVSGSDGGTTTSLIEVVWTSSLGDALPSANLDDSGEHTFSVDDLALGEHVIAATVTDQQGETCVDEVDVLVHVGELPQVEILVPLAGGFFYVDRPLTMRSHATDAEDGPEDLRLHWALAEGSGLAEDLVPNAQGESEIERSLEIGEHELVVTVADSHGNYSQDSVTITVGGPNQPPRCEFVSPGDGDSVPFGPSLNLVGLATDPNVPATALDARFSSDVDGPLGSAVPDDDGDVTLSIPSLSSGAHVLLLHVEDDLGVPCEDSVAVFVDKPPGATITAPAATTVPSDNVDLALQGTVQDDVDALDTLSIRWLADGSLIADAPADATGLLDDLASALAPGTHTVTLEVTDSVGGVGTDTIEVWVNSAPTAPVVILGPPAPTTVDELSAAVTVPASDPDNDPITYDYTWLIDGVPAPLLTGTAVPSAETATPQVWTVEVRADDGLTLGPPGVASVTIDNTPPSAGSATVTPSLGTSATTFSLLTTGWSDIDGDAEGYLYQWVVAGSPVVGATAATFVPSAATPGDALHCELIPWDGVDTGIPFISSPSFINNPATVGGVSIGPSPAYETTTINATVTGLNDPEGAPTTLLHQWYLDTGSLAAIPGATGASLTGADFDHGDTVVLGVSVDDGTEIGPETLSNAVPVLNTPPTTTTPTITPPILYTETVATCLPGTTANPDPDTVTLQYSWEVAGAPVANQTTATLDGAFHFDRGQNVRCIVTPHDGLVAGTPQPSALEGVSNTPPTAPVVQINPQTPADDNALACAHSAPSYDADGDTVSYARAWTLGGAGTPYTSQGLFASLTSIGDVWECTMSPWDGFDTGPVGSDTVTVQASQSLNPGPPGTTYTQQAQTRGMWFTAPTNLAITGLFVPDDPGLGEDQNLQVVLLPPTFAAGSSTATAITLFYDVELLPGDVVVTNIPVLAGDRIGILGARGGNFMSSMYSATPAPVSVQLAGVAVDLHRLEYADNLRYVQAGTVADATGPIGRVEFEYIP